MYFHFTDTDKGADRCSSSLMRLPVQISGPWLNMVTPCIFVLQTQKKSKGGKKKKQTLKFVVDCTHPVEDGIIDCSNFVSFKKMLFEASMGFISAAHGHKFAGGKSSPLLMYIL